MYDRKSTYLPEQVLPFVIFANPNCENKESRMIDFHGDLIQMDSLRYQTFAQSICCVTCGLRGQYFAKERQRSNKRKQRGRYHFNLYGVRADGTEVMLTKDHIIPASKGGRDHITNFQTMCYDCNQQKGDALLV